jgi:tetrapyrrole methylase family protein/MazG family protein
VFADTAVDGAADVVVNWERLKRTEKHERLSVLEGVPRGLPALAFAQGVQKRPARLGFDELSSSEAAIVAARRALDRVTTDATEHSVPTRRGQDWTDSTGDDAIGELLFAVVALARRLRVNPEDALRTRTNLFADRFRRLEEQARADAVDLHDLDAAEWERRWEAAAAT